MQFFIGNLDSLEQKLNLKKHKDIPMCEILKEKEVKKILKIIPREYNIENIKKFEKETGIFLKYWIFTKTTFFEYTKLGKHPIKGNNFNTNFLEQFDIGVAIEE